MHPALLFASKDPRARERVSAFARAHGCAVQVLPTAREAHELARRLRPDVLVVDRKDALDAPEERATALLAIDADGGPDLEQRLELALRVRALERENARLLATAERARPPALEGGSREARRLNEVVRRVASTPRTTVLIHGERGVGKEAVAHAIHRSSSRADGPFVVLRCLELDRRELARGLRDAEHGTLLFDEVCELAGELQVELARFLQERQVRREPGEPDRALDVRIVATTRHDLARRVDEQRLREDLYYRLNVLSVEVPPLRARREDLVELVNGELERLAIEGEEPPQLTRAALARLAGHIWPGNLRELRNVLERAVLQARGRPIEPEDLGLAPGPDAVAPAALESGEVDALPLGDRSLRSVEEALVRRVLDESRGNRSRAARVLGVNRTTLYNKLKQYGIAGA